VYAKPFGSTGVDVPVIGQGTWDLPERGAPAEEAVRTLRRGIELGMVHIDTAEMYGDGRVEELVADAIGGVPRERLFLTSKVLPSNATLKGTIAACDRSLRRLRTAYLDLYLLHWPGSHPLDATMQALESLVAAGKTRFIGVSNFDLNELREARSYLRDVPLACNEVLYHLRERGIEHRILPYCEREQIAVVGYTPFGRGRFPRDATRSGGVLEHIARNRGATPRQVILAFLTRRPALFAIPKASQVEHVEENAGAADLRLNDEEIAAIDRAFPVGEERPLASL
jgi:diketogulonate reductase-like aldo/keto reductase